uniref:Uncharacterized protein n=1 Tax=Oncorhynchus tshawytscha TaxID=74940 RepID=A0A8C8CTK7_ONCTS
MWTPRNLKLSTYSTTAPSTRTVVCSALLFPVVHNHHLFTSPDTLSVLTHMALEDPSALTLASAASTQAREHGDGAGMVLLLAASLLTQAKDLLTLGVTGAEIQGGYRQACGRALALLEGMACGALKDPREELDVRAILGPFLSSWQPGFEALLSGVVARCCVHSWRPITSGDRGEVWEGVTFDPSCVRVCTVLEKAIPDQGSETEDGQIETDGEELIQTKGEGEERTGVEEVQMMKEEGKETGKEMEKVQKVRGEERNRSDRRGRLYEVLIHGSFAKLISHCSTQRQIYKHITSVRSAQRRRRLHRPKGHLTKPRVVPGAGASEVGLAAGLTQNGLTLVGMEQLAVHAFAQALLEPVKALGENGGTPAELAVLRGYKRRWKGKMDGTKGAYRGVLDRLGCKASAIEKATKASLVVLTELLIPAPTPATCPPCPHGDRTHLGRREWMGGWIN